jgi:hypothetical protein
LTVRPGFSVPGAVLAGAAGLVIKLDGHRLGLKAARQDRLELISRSTGHLMARMDARVSGGR